MTKSSASVATAGFALLLLAAGISTHIQAQGQAQDQDQAPTSQVRIVRVSEIHGEVQLDRGDGHGFEPTVANMPVVQADRLRTADGVAEVEFEDNSTLRVGPDSEVQFLQLGRTAAGGTVSTVKLVRGTAYVSLVKTDGKVANQFNLGFGDRMVALQPDTHVRLEMGDPVSNSTANPEAKLAVLSGTVHVDEPNGAVDISRKKTATFALTDNSEVAVNKNVAADPLDAWDKQAVQYHERAVSMSRFGGVPYSYGLADMMYYGRFADEGGCGMMWRPYFTSAAWSPYASGVWANYAGTGYTWVSPYPWGWTPYHYGDWSYCPGTGWGWQPSGSWHGLNNMPVKRIKGGPRLPVVPPPPPHGAKTPSLLGYNLRALVSSGVQNSGSFVFRKDSAGLGIPRNELGNLKGFSERADQRGVAATPVYMSGGSELRASNGFQGRSGGAAPVEMHRGYSAPDGGSRSVASSSSMSTGDRGGSSASFSAPASSVSSSVSSGSSAGGARR
jgi:hypothetical protein